MQLHTLLDQGVTLLTASRRLAHAVRLGYARHAQRQGLHVWRSPRALPWNAWLHRQRCEVRAAASDAHTRILTPAQARVLWDDVVASSGVASELLNPSSAARLAARSWRKLHEYLIPLERLRAFDTPEATALHAWCTEFARRCATLAAIDEARLAHWAYDCEWLPEERLAFAGFDVMPPAMRRLVERWSAHDRIVDIESTAQRANAITIVAAADADAELELAAQWTLARLGEGARDIGVIIADLSTRREAVRRVFEDVYAPGMLRTGVGAVSMPVVIAAPAPLAGYPLIDAALLVLQLASCERASTHAGRILRSPFIGGGQEAARRARADVRLRDEQRDRWDWFELERWAGVAGCMHLALAARAVSNVIRSGLNPAKPSEWAERFQALLRAAGWPGERTLSTAEHQTLEKFQTALGEFGALDAIAGRLGVQQALGRLESLLRETPFEPDAPGAAVTVIDATTSAGMHFDALWVAGLNADRLPSPVAPDSLIPLELQREAGMQEAAPAGVLQLAQLQLQRWTAGAESVVLSWPQRDGDAELAMSPLLTRVEATSAENPAPQRTASLRRMLFDHRPLMASLQDDHAPALSAEGARGGARILELQSRCPFRAQAELRLNARALPRVSIGVEPLDRGALLHRVLADVWGELRTLNALLATNEATLEARVRASAARHAAQALRPVTRHRNRLAALEVDHAVRQVMRLIAHERTRPPFTVRFAETAEQYAIGGLAITLRPDRIDELADGGELLIDYKLGDSHRPRDWLDVRPGRPSRPQLPLYGLAHGAQLHALAYVVLAPGAVEYRGWSDGAEVGAGVAPYPAGIRTDLGDPMDWEALMHHWRFTLTRLAERFVAGDASVDPLPLECTTCHLSTLCRIHERSPDDREAEALRDA